MNQDEKLIRMANQIAGYFESYSEEQAKAGIHDHIVSFWTPKMRDRLQRQALQDGSGLHPLVFEALHDPIRAANPAQKEAAGPGEVGEIGASDAG